MSDNNTPNTLADEGSNQQNNPPPLPKLSLKTLDERINAYEVQIGRLEATVRILLAELDAQQIIGGATIKGMTKVINGEGGD